MPIWNVASVDDEPEIRLENWSVWETERGERHFVGSRGRNNGRVSSAIKAFDPASRKGVTESGRIYQLVGRPGSDPDALYVWNVWKRVNRVQSATNVTDQLGMDLS